MIQPLNRRRFSAGLALAPWAAGGLLTGCSNIPDSIKIGVAQPLSGPLSALGKDLLNGVQLAVNELNKANFSIEGKRVTLEVMSVDDKADAATGKAVAQQLVDAGVVAVVGHLNSGVSIETAPIYAAAGIAQIAISTNPKFTQLGHDHDLPHGGQRQPAGAGHWFVCVVAVWRCALCRAGRWHALRQGFDRWCGRAAQGGKARGGAAPVVRRQDRGF
jgi:hypothetical protein